METRVDEGQVFLAGILISDTQLFSVAHTPTEQQLWKLGEGGETPAIVSLPLSTFEAFLLHPCVQEEEERFMGTFFW